MAENERTGGKAEVWNFLQSIKEKRSNQRLIAQQFRRFDKHTEARELVHGMQRV